MPRIGTRLLRLNVDGVEYTAEISKATISSGERESDFVSFADAAAGGARDYVLNFVAAQDDDADTLWDLVYNSPGQSAECRMAPHGNDVATLAEKHYEFTVTVTEPDGDFLGTEADKSTTAVATFEGAWPCTRPVPATAGNLTELQ